MTEPQIKWILHSSQRRAFWPHRKCAITGERIGFGARYNKVDQVMALPPDGWLVPATEASQYISTQGLAILMLQGIALIEKVERCSSRIGPGG